ncbi:MAG: hypothetical protein RR107_05660 [Clostridia bacterium]
MSNPIEVSLENLAEVSMQIMKKCIDTGELTRADILFLTMYQKEKSRAVAVPTYKKVISGFKEIISTIKDIFPPQADNVKPKVDDVQATEIVEVDTNEL